jgi:hypothetical protein
VKVGDVYDIIFKPKGFERLYLPETKKELLLGALAPITPPKNENEFKDMGRFALRSATVSGPAPWCARSWENNYHRVSFRASSQAVDVNLFGRPWGDY